MFEDCLDEGEHIPVPYDVSKAVFEAPLDSVPNKFPTVTNVPYRIAIIGDYASKDDVAAQRPFAGMQGKLLNGLLSRAGIIAEACFLGTVNETLIADVERFNPNICLLLGDAFKSAHSGSLETYRGTIFICNVTGPFLNRKCLGTYHPTRIFRQYGDIAYLWFDILKAYNQATTSTFIPVERNLETAPSFQHLLERLETSNRCPLISLDIEGYWNNIFCCSVAESSTDSYIVPFTNLDGTSYWTEDEEVEIWKAFRKLMGNPAVNKVWQNGLYDRFCFQYGYGIFIASNVDDTMLKFWEKWCELEKNLGVQSSILTTEPYYKGERKSQTKEEFYRYCCKDSAITYEINQSLNSKLSPSQRTHYQLDVAVLNAILYMELRGIRYDKTLAEARLKEINQHIYTHQSELDELAGVGINVFDDRESIKRRVCETMCYKRDGVTPKKEYQEDFYSVMVLLKNTAPLTKQQIGFINKVCKWSINVDSPQQMQKYLYVTLGLPKQTVTVRGFSRVTTDLLALLKLKKHLKTHPDATKDRCLDLIIELGLLSTRASALHAGTDPDGRIRCGYNLVGTDTGRIACYESPTGSGFNLQTVTKGIPTKPKDHPLYLGMRDHFRADPGYHLFQCDLAGADGWTVGCHLARLGDPTMLDDLRFGLKPAAVICYMARHGNNSLQGLDRAHVKALLKEIKSEDWDYFAYKQCIWGLCYTMGPDKMILTVAKKSAGAIWLTRDQINKFRASVLARYDITRWHRYTQAQLHSRPEITAASGHVRKFWGRSSDILGQALAHEPQANTTYATNLAAWRLWTDKDNRKTSGHSLGLVATNTILRIEPLHQVHDALLGQFRIEDTTWAVDRIKSYFANEIVIAGTRLVIPFDGAYGESWGNLEAGRI